MPPLSAAQTRIVNAALGLFAEQGVNGTSLQMIADALGVTKAAVYHQFHTKDEIVLAVMEAELASLDEAVTRAEAEADRARAVEVVVEQVVDLAVGRRHVVSALQSDPVVARLLGTHEPFPSLMERLYRILIGGNGSAEARLAAAMISAGIGGAVSHPLIAELDDDTLRAQLLEVAHRLLELPATT